MSRNRYNILWILILAAALRFIQIGAPPVGRHAWRQSDTASVARNFHQNGHRLLYPQIDWEIPGFVEMEFPIYPWTASLLYRWFGESEALARALAVLGSLITIAFLYLLVGRILGRGAALWAAFFYAVLPVNLFFGRAIMPESWMLAATVAALYLFLRWVEDDSRLFYWLALLAATLACLLKLTSLYLGLPLLWLAWQKWGRSSHRQWRIWLFAGVVTASLILWYGHAFRLGQEYGASFHILTAAGTDKWGTWGLLVDPDFYHRVFVGNLGGRMLTWAGFPVFLVGLFLQRRSRLEHLFDVWLVAATVILLVASAGSYRHDYYSLPIVLPAVVFMAKVFDRGWQRFKPWLAALVLLILVLSGYRHAGALAEEQGPGAEAKIADALARETTANDLVISCNKANPVWLYSSRRRGWGRDCQTLDKKSLEDLLNRGARYLVAAGHGGRGSEVQQDLWLYLEAFFDVIEDSDDVFLVQLSDRRKMEDLEWQTVILEDFAEESSHETWTFDGGSWRVAEGSLVGDRIRQPANALTREPIPACGICRVRMSLELSRPPQAPTDAQLQQPHRGAGRSDSQAAVDLWWSDSDTGVTLTFATKSGSVGLHQHRNGRRIHSSRIDYPVFEGQTIDLELRSDGFEFGLLLDGEPVLSTPNRLSPPLSGRFRLRPRLGSIRLHRLEVETPKRPPPARQPFPSR